jgi:hypothetical protein
VLGIMSCVGLWYLVWGLIVSSVMWTACDWLSAGVCLFPARFIDSAEARVNEWNGLIWTVMWFPSVKGPNVSLTCCAGGLG